MIFKFYPKAIAIPEFIMVFIMPNVYFKCFSMNAYRIITIEMEDEKIVIIGGGIVGCATAYMIKRASPSSKVLILERGNDLGQDSSYQNGGALTYSFHHPWKAKTLLYKCIKSFGDPTAFNKITPSALVSPSFWWWVIRFFSSSFSGLPQRDDAIFTLAKRTLELHNAFRVDLLNKLGESFEEYLGDDQGLIKVYSDIIDFQGAKAKGLALNLNKGEMVHIHSSRDSCSKYEPSIKEWKQDVVGCMKNHLELFGAHDSRLYTRSLGKLAQKSGAAVEYHAEVKGVNIKDNKIESLVLSDGRVILGDKFVVCCGVGSRNVGQVMGWTPPVWPVKGYSVNMRTEKKIYHTMQLMGKYPIYIAPLGKHYRVSGMLEFTGLDDKDVSQDRIKFMEDHVKSNMKIEDAEFEGYWACQRPVSSDDMPIIGEFPGLKNAYINTGHGGRGSILSLGSGELLTQILMKTSPLVDPLPFSPNRFYF